MENRNDVNDWLTAIKAIGLDNKPTDAAKATSLSSDDFDFNSFLQNQLNNTILTGSSAGLPTHETCSDNESESDDEVYNLECENDEIEIESDGYSSERLVVRSIVFYRRP